MTDESTASAIFEAFRSPNVSDSNGEAANVVDVIDSLGSAIEKVALAIRPRCAMAGTDAAGGSVDSLIEAVMGVTSGLCQIASAINRLAEAVEDHS